MLEPFPASYLYMGEPLELLGHLKKKPELSPLPQLLQKKRAQAAPITPADSLTRLFHLMYIFVIYPLVI